MTLITFPERRTPAASTDLVCACGSRWFDLVAVDRSGRENPGGVLLDSDYRVVGYTGAPRCRECGKRV